MMKVKMRAIKISTGKNRRKGTAKKANAVDNEFVK